MFEPEKHRFWQCASLLLWLTPLLLLKKKDRSSLLVFLQRCGLSGLQKPLLYLQSSWVRPRIVLCKTKEEKQKKRRSFFVKTKYKEKIEY